VPATTLAVPVGEGGHPLNKLGPGGSKGQEIRLGEVGVLNVPRVLSETVHFLKRGDVSQSEKGHAEAPDLQVDHGCRPGPPRSEQGADSQPGERRELINRHTRWSRPETFGPHQRPVPSNTISSIGGRAFEQSAGSGG